MEELTQSFENITIESNFNITILDNIKKYLEIIHCVNKYSDEEVKNVHQFWKELNKIYKQNILDYIYQTIHNDDNLINKHLKMESKIYKANIYLFTHYLINILY